MLPRESEKATKNHYQLKREMLLMETKPNRIATALQLLTFAAAMLLGGGISGVARAQPATTKNLGVIKQ